MIFFTGVAVSLLFFVGFGSCVTVQPPSVGDGPPQADMSVEPERGYWNYTQNGEYCILCAMAIRLTFQYEGADGMDYEVSYDVPAHNETVDDPAILNGSFCDVFDRDQQRMRNRLRIHFFEDDWILEFDFYYDYNPEDGYREWYMADVDIYYTYNKKYFPELNANINIKQQATLDRIVFFNTELRESYWCDSQLDTSATDRFQFYALPDEPMKDPVPQRLTISAWKTRLEAFARSKNAEFHPPSRCVEDQYIPRLVPGIIGGIVCGSIICALSMYSIQRKAKNRDYNSDVYYTTDEKEEKQKS